MFKRLQTLYQQTITNITIWLDQWIFSLRLKQLKQELAIYAEQLISKIPQSKQTFLKCSLQPFLSPTSTCREDISHQKLMMLIAQRVVDRLQVDQFIGVQPLNSPVGEVFLMQQRQMEDSQQRVLEVVSATVESKTRMLAASYAKETIDHLAKLHDLDFCKECSKAIADEIVYEITTEIVTLLTQISNKTTSDAQDSEKMVDAICTTCVQVGSENQRGIGNVVLVSDDVYEKIKQSSKFIEYQQYGQIADICQKVGMIDDIWVIKCTTMERGTSLVCYKGPRGEADVGAVFCPYTIVRPAGTQINEDLITTTQLMSRYAIYTNDKSVNYYKLITFNTHKN